MPPKSRTRSHTASGAASIVSSTLVCPIGLPLPRTRYLTTEDAEERRVSPCTSASSVVKCFSSPSRRTRRRRGRARRAGGRWGSAPRSATARPAAPSRRRARRAAPLSSRTLSGCCVGEVDALGRDRSARSKSQILLRPLGDLQLPVAGEHAAVVARAPEQRLVRRRRPRRRARAAAGRRRRSRDRPGSARAGRRRGGGEDVDVRRPARRTSCPRGSAAGQLDEERRVDAALEEGHLPAAVRAG